MNQFTIFDRVKRYVGKVRTLRNEVRTERLLNSLSCEVQTDIGWPDMHEDWRRNRK